MVLVVALIIASALFSAVIAAFPAIATTILLPIVAVVVLSVVLITNLGSTGRLHLVVAILGITLIVVLTVPLLVTRLVSCIGIIGFGSTNSIGGICAFHFRCSARCWFSCIRRTLRTRCNGNLLSRSRLGQS